MTEAAVEDIAATRPEPSTADGAVDIVVPVESANPVLAAAIAGTIAATSNRLTAGARLAAGIHLAGVADVAAVIRRRA